MIPHFESTVDPVTGEHILADITGSRLGQWRNVSGRAISLDAPISAFLREQEAAGNLAQTIGEGIFATVARAGNAGPAAENVVVRWPAGAVVDLDVLFPAGIHDRTGHRTREALLKKGSIVDAYPAQQKEAAE